MPELTKKLVCSRNNGLELQLTIGESYSYIESTNDSVIYIKCNTDKIILINRNYFE